MIQRRHAYLLLCLIAVSACYITDPSDGPGDWDGMDEFRVNSLDQYSMSAHEGKVDVWSVEEGRLVAKSDGTTSRARLVRQDEQMRDGRLQIESSQMANGAILFRFQENGDHYRLEIRDDETSYYNMTVRNFELYAKVLGAEESVLSEDLDLPRGSPFSVSVEFVGDHVSMYLNGERVSEAVHSGLSNAGSVGLGYGDLLTPGEEAHFEVFRWRSLD
ncbi:MAG TPA: family 16 glycoside hydrolase [Longimicrobiaceae bacterium]|nr:family 16 glycoside hydrolase [Longimicrobiaceae bacterium]